MQIAWLLLLLTFCSAARANYRLRTVPPELTAEYVRLQCLCDVLHIRNGLPGQTLQTVSLPLTLGGLGVGGTNRVRDAAFWGSFADCLEMVKARHPQVAQQVVCSPLFGGESTGEVAKWAPCVSPVLPIHKIGRMDPEPFRVLLLKRLRKPFPLNVPACRCGHLLDVIGHHHAACSRVGELGKRVFATESIVAQICREGGARLSTNVMLRDLDISPPHSSDGRRLKWWQKGCVCSAVPAGDGTHRRKADVEDGVSLKEQEEAKRPHTRSCVGVMVEHDLWSLQERLEAGGLKKQRTSWCLACEKSKSSPRLLQGSVRVGWYRRWCCVSACSTAKAVSGLFSSWARIPWVKCCRLRTRC